MTETMKPREEEVVSSSFLCVNVVWNKKYDLVLSFPLFDCGAKNLYS